MQLRAIRKVSMPAKGGEEYFVGTASLHLPYYYLTNNHHLYQLKK